MLAQVAQRSRSPSADGKQERPCVATDMRPDWAMFAEIWLVNRRRDVTALARPPHRLAALDGALAGRSGNPSSAPAKAKSPAAAPQQRPGSAGRGQGKTQGGTEEGRGFPYNPLDDLVMDGALTAVLSQVTRAGTSHRFLSPAVMRAWLDCTACIHQSARPRTHTHRATG